MEPIDGQILEQMIQFHLSSNKHAEPLSTFLSNAELQFFPTHVSNKMSTDIATQISTMLSLGCPGSHVKGTEGGGGEGRTTVGITQQ